MSGWSRPTRECWYVWHVPLQQYLCSAVCLRQTAGRDCCCCISPPAVLIVPTATACLPACRYTYTAADVDRVLKEKKAKGQAPLNAGAAFTVDPRCTTFALHPGPAELCCTHGPCRGCADVALSCRCMRVCVCFLQRPRYCPPHPVFPLQRWRRRAWSGSWTTPGSMERQTGQQSA
jgi:hypothetical protein